MKCIDDFINGNLTDAKLAARRKSWCEIYEALIAQGKGHAEAKAVANYLKGKGTFQEACNAAYD